MDTEEFLARLQQAVVDVEDEEVARLLQEGIDAGVAPMDMIMGALSPGLKAVGELVRNRERSVSDMVLAGEILNNAVRILRPVMEAGAPSTGERMVIGTIKGTRHNVQGKKLVAAMFTGAGYRVVDIGEDMPAAEFVRAVQELKATIVGASAIGSLKPQCKLLNDALIEAGIRDDVIYIIGGWGITEEWCNSVGADAFGEHAVDALDKVRALLNGDLPRWRDKAKHENVQRA